MKGCRNCLNWEAMDEFLDRLDPATQGKNAQLGHCRRYAPRPLTQVTVADGAEPSWDTFWPRVASDDWCGEWDPKFD